FETEYGDAPPPLRNVTENIGRHWPNYRRAMRPQGKKSTPCHFVKNDGLALVESILMLAAILLMIFSVLGIFSVGRTRLSDARLMKVRSYHERNRIDEILLKEETLDEICDLSGILGTY